MSIAFVCNTMYVDDQAISFLYDILAYHYCVYMEVDFYYQLILYIYASKNRSNRAFA